MQRRSIEVGLVLGTAAALAVACGSGAGDPGASRRAPPVGEAGDGPGGAGTGSTATGGTAPIGRPRPRTPEGGEGGMREDPPDGVGGGGGMGVVVPTACAGDIVEVPDMTMCGDGHRATTEECDDGNGSADDSCSATCRVRDFRPLATPSIGVEQVMSRGRHPIGAGCAGAALAYVERDTGLTTAASVILARFDRGGALRGVTRDVGVGSIPAAAANPVVAELGGGAFAVAWTDLGGDGDGLGVALNRVNAETGRPSALSFANATTFAAQSDPDLLWVGDTLVAAWVDHSNLTRAPDLRLRKFSIDLEPLGEEETLAETPSHEANVALAPFRGSWAAAFRSSSAGLEHIEVRAGGESWTVGPFLPGSSEERPALVELDPEHLLLVFTEGTDPSESGVADVTRLRGAILGVPGPTPSFEIAPRMSPYSEDSSVAQLEPNVVRSEDRVYVSWRSSTVTADPRGEEVWLKEIPFAREEGEMVVDLGSDEIALPRFDEHREGDQRHAALHAVPFAFGSAIATAWMDFGAFGASPRGPGPVFELIPTPVLRLLPSEGSP